MLFDAITRNVEIKETQKKPLMMMTMPLKINSLEKQSQQQLKTLDTHTTRNIFNFKETNSVDIEIGQYSFTEFVWKFLFFLSNVPFRIFAALL